MPERTAPVVDPTQSEISGTRCPSMNREKASPTGVALIHSLYEEQVTRTPDAIALVFGDTSITYADLNRRANKLAHYLREHGVSSDERVGLCVDRCIDLLIGILGILKSGAAYVPLDPAYPADRRAYMLADAAPKVLLTHECLRRGIPDTSATLIMLDTDWHEIAKHDPDNIDTRALGLCPAHAAYVIYTSGSTGRPKGVVVDHRNVTRLFSSTAPWFDFSHRDVWTLFHSVSFDFSVWEIWGALLHGGRLIIVPHLVSRSPQDFYRLLCAVTATVLNQTPSAFAQLVDAQSRSSEAHSLRVVIFGGEMLEPRILRPWIERNRIDQPQLVNMYGITETTVHVTYYLLTREDIELNLRSPIGSAIPDLTIHLLDSRLTPVPIDSVGEIYVGGAGLARGYLNQPGLTVERFIPDPFGTESVSRLYKSGDLGRQRADGIIEYLGRNDHQVKIRGFRIELGEIESQLTRLPEVRDAVVIAREDIPGEKRLVAYVVPSNVRRRESLHGHFDVEFLNRSKLFDGNEIETGGDVSVGQEIDWSGYVDNSMAGDERVRLGSGLREALKTLLPEHMVPSALVIMERLPLTLNGKLDRRGLPKPDYDAHVANRYAAPNGAVEIAIAKIWADVLHLEHVGRLDNFFELGGHSLQGIKLSVRVAEQFGVELPPPGIFHCPTVQQMADVICDLLPELRAPSNKGEVEEFIL